MGCLVGIDVGTGSTKAVIVDPARGGSVRGAGAFEYVILTPEPRAAEQDPETWWVAVAVAVRGALAASGLAAGDIAGIGLTGQMQGSVFLDYADRVLRPALLWCDQRTGDAAERISEVIGPARVVELTCNPSVAARTMSKIVWFREREPALYARMNRLLLPKDYIRLRLTGEHATDVTDASATGLFDVRARAWSTAMADALAVSEGWLPPAYESTVVTGRVTASAAAATGLAPGTPVVAGSGDNAASAVGAGAVEPGRVASNLGTAAVLLATTDTVRVDPLSRLSVACHAVPGRWQMIGAVNAGGASLRWLKDTFGEAERAEADRTGADVYDLLSEEAAGVPSGSDGLIFLPHLLGMRTPIPDPKATGAFFGIRLGHTKSHFVRAVLEGVAFGVRDSVEVFRELDLPLTEVRAIGGGSRSPLWCQVQADVLGLDHATVSVTECAAFGAALLAGVGIGCYADITEACDATIRVRAKFTPSAGSSAVHEQNYRAYRAMTLAAYEFNSTADASGSA
jgi:xylulokinase